MELETNADNFPTESDERARRLRELEDRSLWSGRRRRVT
jgi:hypothetical protein